MEFLLFHFLKPNFQDLYFMIIRLLTHFNQLNLLKFKALILVQIYILEILKLKTI